MKTNFTLEDNAGNNIIDSRDIIARYEELNDQFESLEDAVTEARSELEDYVTDNPTVEGEEDEDLSDLQETLDCAMGDLAIFNTFEGIELEVLKQVVEDGEGSPDWQHGECLVLDDYFTDYTEELINDTCELPKEFKSRDWPWRHMKIDYEEAADELKSDYFDIEIGDYTYWIRA